MNELSTSLHDLTATDFSASTQNGRKGISYDWQSLLVHERELVSAFAE